MSRLARPRTRPRQSSSDTRASRSPRRSFWPPSRPSRRRAAQRHRWQQAIALARTGIEQFKPYVGQTGHAHLANLPFWFEEGPYVLKSYAFGYYYFPQSVPTVSATALTLALVDGRVRQLTRVTEPGAPPPPSDTDTGTSVTFRLDVN